MGDLMQGPHAERRQCPRVAVLLVAAFLAATPCLPYAARAEDTAVVIDDFAFSPPNLTVKAGTTITWRNKDDIPHTVASTTRVFKSKALDTGDNFSFTFSEPGTYAYFCSLHPHMTGKIVVEPANHAGQ